MRIPDKLTDRTGTECTALIAPTTFCATRYMNDAKPCFGDRTTEWRRKFQLRREEGDFEQTFCLKSSQDLVDHKIMRL